MEPLFTFMNLIALDLLLSLALNKLHNFKIQHCLPLLHEYCLKKCDI